MTIIPAENSRNHTFSEDLYSYFYDEACASEHRPFGGGGKNSGLNGVEFVNDAFLIFGAPLRIESTILDFMAIIILVMLLQLGGIILPTPDNWIAISLWTIISAIVLLQMVMTALAIALIGIAFGSLRSKMEPCAQGWRADGEGGMSFIDVAALPVIFLQPAVLSRLFILASESNDRLECLSVHPSVTVCPHKKFLFCSLLIILLLCIFFAFLHSSSSSSSSSFSLRVVDGRGAQGVARHAAAQGRRPGQLLGLPPHL